MDVRRCVTALVLGLATLCSVGSVGQPALAQSTLSVRGNVGASFFRSPDLTRELLHSGTNVGLEAGIRVYRGLSVTVGVGYDGFTLNEDNARLYGQEGSDLAFMGGNVGFRYTVENQSDAHPYVALGGGLYQVRRTNRQMVTSGGTLVPDENRSTTTVEEGMHVAIGSLFRIDDTYAVFVEPRYMVFDVTEGVDEAVRYFTIRLGVDVQL